MSDSHRAEEIISAILGDEEISQWLEAGELPPGPEAVTMPDELGYSREIMQALQKALKIAHQIDPKINHFDAGKLFLQARLRRRMQND